MVLTAWALEIRGISPPEETSRLEAQYLQEQHKIELELLRLQLQCREGRITPAECQAAIEKWAETERGRLAAQAERAELLDKLKPQLGEQSSSAAGDRPLSPEEKELKKTDASIKEALSPLQKESATPFEAQEKIDRWAHTEAGTELLQKREALQHSVNSARWSSLSSYELEEPENGTPAQLAVLDAHEKILGEWLAIKTSVPDGDPFKIQALVAAAESSLKPLRSSLEKAREAAELEDLRRQVRELEGKISLKQGG